MKKIVINAGKCTGCRTCEVVCSLTHSKGVINPRESRIRVYRDDVGGIFTPLIPGSKIRIEYVHRPQFLLQEKTGDINMVCDLFADPSERCDQCGVCAKWCVSCALTVEEV